MTLRTDYNNDLKKFGRYTDREDDFIINNYNKMSEEEISSELKRCKGGIKIKTSKKQQVY